MSKTEIIESLITIEVHISLGITIHYLWYLMKNVDSCEMFLINRRVKHFDKDANEPCGCQERALTNLSTHLLCNM